MKNLKYVKAAEMIRQALVGYSKAKQCENRAKMDFFDEKCRLIQKDIRQYNLAVSRGWLKAAGRVRARLIRNIANHQCDYQQFRDYIYIDQQVIPKLSDIYAEIVQLENEFDDFSVDSANGKICVMTDHIELEGMDFGTFNIELNLREMVNLNKESSYRVVAQEPNRAGTEYEVTHPHVSHNRLCEGDGYNTIRKALTQGRLTDFFMIVENILKTYNPESPYVSLEDWDGTPCYSCGYNVSGDDSYYCECCDRDFCSECSTYCQKCDTTICLGCSYECPECNEPICDGCKATCKDCEEEFCSDCVNEDGYCESCESKRKENDDEEIETRFAV